MSGDGERPYVAIWETTQACQLACLHCRASARPHRSPLELSTAEAENLLCQIRALEVPVFVLTGGDPLERPDLTHLVRYGSQIGLHVALTPSATPLLTREALAGLQQAGLARVAVSLDGSHPALHDGFRGVPGSFDRTLAAIAWAHELGLPVQINSTLSRHNREDFEALAALVSSLGIVLWSVFFLIPTGRARMEDMLGAEECEQVFARLYELSQQVPFAIKTTEGMHYRRYALQRRASERRAGLLPADTPLPRPARNINDGKGFVFISHTGLVYPSGFLPLGAGSIRTQTLADIYRNSPLFQDLRRPERLGGKCGACEFRDICGGSRARAYALTGDPLAADPACLYQPRAVPVA
jgi:radical SAM protein